MKIENITQLGLSILIGLGATIELWSAPEERQISAKRL
jgi:hypothetical protein